MWFFNLLIMFKFLNILFLNVSSPLLRVLYLLCFSTWQPPSLFVLFCTRNQSYKFSGTILQKQGNCHLMDSYRQVAQSQPQVRRGKFMMNSIRAWKSILILKYENLNTHTHTYISQKFHSKYNNNLNKIRYMNGYM